MKNYNFKEKLEEIFNASTFQCLATSFDDSPWANPLWIKKDERWNLYFRSLPETLHMQNITTNKKVSVAIYSSNQRKPLKGIQILGKAKILLTKPDIEEAMEYYLGKKDDMTAEDYLSETNFKLVRITPLEIYIFDQEAFEESRVIVDPKFYA
ncbi:MAG: pyridoxamine 5'-phosphate oxidase family protein [Candidatus Dojkabacteria bacterium]